MRLYSLSNEYALINRVLIIQFVLQFICYAWDNYALLVSCRGDDCINGSIIKRGIIPAHPFLKKLYIVSGNNQRAKSVKCVIIRIISVRLKVIFIWDCIIVIFKFNPCDWLLFTSLYGYHISRHNI